MIIEGKDKGIFCIINESYKNFNAELDKKLFYAIDRRYHNLKDQIS